MAVQLKLVVIVAVVVIVMQFGTSSVNSQQLTATLPPRAPSCALSCAAGDNDKMCASNGITYKNQCRFDCAKQRNKHSRTDITAMFKSVVQFPDADSPTGAELWTSALHCFICADVHTRTIYYCESGHLVCQKCSTTDRASGTVTGLASGFTYATSAKHARCSCAKKITPIRATYLENIVRATRFICEHECGQALTNEEYAFHVEEGCRFRRVNCPLCSTLVDYKNYMRHLRRVHNVGTFDLDENGEAQLLISKQTEPMYITQFDDKQFFMRWDAGSSKFWVQSFQNTKGVSVQVEATTFRCTIKISKAHNALSCPDTDVVRLVMNERVQLKFNSLSDEIWMGPRPSMSPGCSGQNSAVTSPKGDEEARRITDRTSAMSITSSSSDGTGSSSGGGGGGGGRPSFELGSPTTTIEEGGDPGSPLPPPLPAVAPPFGLAEPDLKQLDNGYIF